jgi:hypothetical protein
VPALIATICRSTRLRATLRLRTFGATELLPSESPKGYQSLSERSERIIIQYGSEILSYQGLSSRLF